jgi:hypothetical protein
VPNYGVVVAKYWFERLSGLGGWPVTLSTVWYNKRIAASARNTALLRPSLVPSTFKQQSQHICEHICALLAL